MDKHARLYIASGLHLSYAALACKQEPNSMDHKLMTLAWMDLRMHKGWR